MTKISVGMCSAASQGLYHSPVGIGSWPRPSAAAADAASREVSCSHGAVRGLARPE